LIASQPELAVRARLSRGTSSPAIYQMVSAALSARGIQGGVLVDVGCGSGELWRRIGSRFAKYIGVDGVLYDDLPPEIEFHCHDFDGGHVPLPSGAGDVVVAVETIEHLENPRAFFRELVRLARPGGWVVITTPNQLSLLSLVTLIFKRRFNAFQDIHYPAHITALLEIDLRRIASECGLQDVALEYSCQGRLVLTARHYPGFLSKRFPRLCSDNLLVIGRRLD
jgi:SAM-dependent methyltransferase